MPVKYHLHQPSAVLRDKNQFEPRIGNLLRLPAHVVDWFNTTTLRGQRLWLLRMNAKVARRRHSDGDDRQEPEDCALLHLESPSIAGISIVSQIVPIGARINRNDS